MDHFEIPAGSLFVELYGNPQVSHGPAAGSPKYWSFETVDIASHLQPGKNIILIFRQAGSGRISMMTPVQLQGKLRSAKL